MLDVARDAEKFRIRIHHIGGIGESGPVENLSQLGHVEWVFYDAQAESLSSVQVPSNLYRLVQRAIGGANSPANFYITEWSSASGLLKPSPRAQNFTFVLGDNRVQNWGRHTKIVKSIEMQVSSLDSLVQTSEVPPADFLSVDAQGAELSILDGASSLLKDSVVGVLCEVEFTELYEKQPLFCDIQARLRDDHFRLCEIYNGQYFNTTSTSPQLRGKGFLTVGEALFLRDATTWLGDADRSERTPSTQGVIRSLKLAAVAVAFDQLDFAIEICRRLESMNLVSLDALAHEIDVKYIKMLRDLSRAATSMQNNHSGDLEPTEEDLLRTRTSHSRTFARIALGLLRFTLLGIVSKIARKISGKWFGPSYPHTSKILHEYGFEELAIRQAIRSAGIPYVGGGYYAHFLDLLMLFLFRYL